MPLCLSTLFSNHIVLQRDKPIPIWGWGDVGTKVVIAFLGTVATTTVKSDGTWRVELPPAAAGGPYELVVHHGDAAVVLRDVLVGDVWICSGQSNMEWTVEKSDNARKEIAAAKYPNIRMFDVAKKQCNTPQTDVPGEWLTCDPENVGVFSAVGYFFARAMHEALNVPIGMIHTSWGGTAAEAWTSLDALDAVPSLKYLADAGRPGSAVEPVVPYVDSGIAAHAKTWADVGLDESDWNPIQIAGTWQNNGGPNENGAGWYRISVDLDPEFAGRDLVLSLGAADDLDDTFFNGQPVGRTTTSTPNFWAHLRQYTVAGKLVKAGRNVIAVRVFDQWGHGGLIGPAGEMFVSPSGSDKVIPLTKGWRFKMETGLPLRSPFYGVMPTQLFNGMIAPFVNAGIRGAIWYQGESNADRAEEYRTLLPVMIRDWRARFGQGDFPFYIVELANWRERQLEPGRSAWAELREAQHFAAKELGNSAVACTIELGDAADIHPTNKQDVGLRLALLALHDTYGKTMLVSRGPTYADMKVEKDSIRVHFTNTAGGLRSSAPARGIVGFTIAGDNGEFVWAEAAIDGTDVIVRAPSVKNPTAVRYAWADNPDCTLVNDAGLPAYPFRTDGIK